ncbi:MAG: putative addiction module antidote protein [Deltaproteobacteria bacterium GWA2_38_16]|nr:MAG: putative addiction module antidote protein [Deltaproteobacteria bacterium GWA2_38_16]OGQ02543.1 MAG: putative addiction module antidote protein [Deltaproteobacteria bacterium RIFCSPHIGHO2_02_FULL_38_15]OGQ34129.1 MAG: putative addiction module antidote protein [Deltaproteobacteria bacterium RIFCSPLOWO2_01_FULL_38_9]OGQ60371.1 MAG: putative addiction module antidote protein [Deltaproteobacteria bacterium RIFCSPLOWO2_12_FULL_38_8]HBQ21002.1 putative addiction module antidote protein [Delt
MTTRKLRSNEEALIGELKNSQEAAAYLSAALEENDLDIFLLALRRVAQAQGVTKISTETSLNRQHIYRALSRNGNPTLKNLMAILSALDFELEVKPRKKAVND